MAAGQGFVQNWVLVRFLVKIYHWFVIFLIFGPKTKIYLWKVIWLFFRRCVFVFLVCSGLYLLVSRHFGFHLIFQKQFVTLYFSKLVSSILQLNWWTREIFIRLQRSMSKNKIIALNAVYRIFEKLFLILLQNLDRYFIFWKVISYLFFLFFQLLTFWISIGYWHFLN